MQIINKIDKIKEAKMPESTKPIKLFYLEKLFESKIFTFLEVGK